MLVISGHLLIEPVNILSIYFMLMIGVRQQDLDNFVALDALYTYFFMYNLN